MGHTAAQEKVCKQQLKPVEIDRTGTGCQVRSSCVLHSRFPFSVPRYIVRAFIFGLTGYFVVLLPPRRWVRWSIKERVWRTEKICSFRVKRSPQPNQPFNGDDNSRCSGHHLETLGTALHCRMDGLTRWNRHCCCWHEGHSHASPCLRFSRSSPRSLLTSSPFLLSSRSCSSAGRQWPSISCVKSAAGPVPLARKGTDLPRLQDASLPHWNSESRHNLMGRTPNVTLIFLRSCHA
jgi:hypothetical protein